MIFSKVELATALCVLIGIIALLAVSLFFATRPTDCPYIDAERLDRLEQLAHPPPR